MKGTYNFLLAFPFSLLNQAHWEKPAVTSEKNKAILWMVQMAKNRGLLPTAETN